MEEVGGAMYEAIQKILKTMDLSNGKTVSGNMDPKGIAVKFEEEVHKGLNRLSR